MIPNAEILISADMLRMLLDLPASMRVVGASASPLDTPHTVRLLVEADELSAVLPGGRPHLVQPIYTRVDTGASELLSLNITTSEHRG